MYFHKKLKKYYGQNLIFFLFFKFYEETGKKRKTTRATCCGPKIDAITEYEKELEV